MRTERFGHCLCRRVIVLLAMTSLTFSNASAFGEAPDGFTSIFNGKDLTGWKGLVGNPKTPRSYVCRRNAGGSGQS